MLNPGAWAHPPRKRKTVSAETITAAVCIAVMLATAVIFAVSIGALH